MTLRRRRLSFEAGARKVYVFTGELCEVYGGIEAGLESV